MTPDEVAKVKAIEALDTAAFTARQQKLLPLPIGLIATSSLLYSLIGFFATFFEAGMIGQVLKAIPTAIDKIQIASEEKQKLEQENFRMGAELDVAQKNSKIDSSPSRRTQEVSGTRCRRQNGSRFGSRRRPLRCASAK